MNNRFNLYTVNPSMVSSFKAPRLKVAVPDSVQVTRHYESDDTGGVINMYISPK